MTADMKASVLLTLEDRLSAGLEKLLGVLDRFAETVDGIGKKLKSLDFERPFDKGARSMDRASHSAMRMERSLGLVGRALRGTHVHMTSLARASERLGMFGAAAGGFAAIQSTRAYADYENVLRHIAISEGKSGAAVGPEIGRLQKLFNSDALGAGQSSMSVATAYSDLVQTGIPASVIDRVIGQHTRAATAYNIAPDALGHAVGALLMNMHIPEGDIGAALASMAVAAKHGRFKVEDFSSQLPGISGMMSALGMTGRGNADMVFAGLETVMKNSSEPQQGAAGFYDMLNYLTGSMARRMFAKQGIDLPGLMHGAEKAGGNPLDAVLDMLAKRTKGMSPVQSGEFLHSVLHNQQAEQAVLALLQHHREFMELRGMLHGVDAGTLATDFATASDAPLVQLRIFDELLAQMERRLGQGMVPALRGANGLLALFAHWMGELDQRLPGVGDWLVSGVGGFILLGTAFGAIGFVLPLVLDGLSAVGALVSLLASPFVLLGAVAVAAVVDIWEHWDRFHQNLSAMWGGFKSVLHGIVDFIQGAFYLNMTQAEHGVEEIWLGLKSFFIGLWGTLKQLALDFSNWFIGWVEGPMAAPLAKLSGWMGHGGDMTQSGLGSTGGFGWMSPAAPVHGEIVVRATPGTSVEAVHTHTGGSFLRISPIGAPNTGRMLGAH